MLVFIDRQHSGKPNKLNDRGACADIDNNGKKDIHELEAIFTGKIAIELEIALLCYGIDVLPISDGLYSKRHQRVNEYAAMYDGPMVYLAMHLNAGGGDYGAFFYDWRSAKGADLAAAMSEELKTLPQIQKCKTIAAKPDDWTQHAFNTISGINAPVAICCEPLFVDNPAHNVLLLGNEGMARIANVMATAIAKWGGIK